MTVSSANHRSADHGCRSSSRDATTLAGCDICGRETRLDYLGTARVHGTHDDTLPRSAARTILPADLHSHRKRDRRR
jgi:hypothetical protein